MFAYRTFALTTAIVTSLTVFGIGHTYAQESDLLDDSTSFGFTADADITVNEVTESSATVQFELVDALNDKAYTYSILYTNADGGIILADPSDVEEVTYNLLDDNDNASFDVISDIATITLEELQANTEYSLVVIPINASDVEGDQSPEITFVTAAPEVNETDTTENADDTTTTDDEFTMGAADDEVSLTAVSHYQDGSDLFLTWTPIEGDYTVEVFFSQLGEDNLPIGEVVASAGEYGPINVEETGTYNTTLNLINNITNERQGATQPYTIKVDDLTEVTEERTIEKTPVVGPTTNIIIGLLLIATLLFIMQRYRREEV